MVVNFFPLCKSVFFNGLITDFICTWKRITNTYLEDDDWKKKSLKFKIQYTAQRWFCTKRETASGKAVVRVGKSRALKKASRNYSAGNNFLNNLKLDLSHRAIGCYLFLCSRN